jgi:hypothetical protein
LKTIPSTVNAALVKTAAAINKAAVTLRLMVHPSSVGLGRWARGFAWKVGLVRVGW